MCSPFIPVSNGPSSPRLRGYLADVARVNALWVQNTPPFGVKRTSQAMPRNLLRGIWII